MLLTLTGRDYQRYLKSILEKIDDERIEFMQGTSLFKTWSKAHCRAFMGYVKTHTMHKGHTVLHQGHASPTLILVKKGSIRLSIKIKKPYSNKTREADVLKEEKFKLKDAIHGIERNTADTLEEQNHAIEGDGSGMMGASEAWPQIPCGHEWYKQREHAN